tara:strand:- start:32570 stop:32923 length:354 start_codon:yes stop_codon:yes gene_type:complete
MLKTVIASMALTLAVLPASAQTKELVCYLTAESGPNADLKYWGSGAVLAPRIEGLKPVTLECQDGYCATPTDATTDGSYIALVVWSEADEIGVDMLTMRPDKPILVIAFAANCSEIS